MWEITIKSKPNYKDSVLYIKDMLISQFNKRVIVGQYNAEWCCISIGTEDKYKTQVWDYLKRLLCDVFCTHFKAEFLHNNITFIQKDNPYFNAFIKVYTYFDLELEHSICYRLIDYTSTIILESYFAFKLSVLKNKWKDLCAITNNNSSVFLSSETFLSLLKFLIDNLNYKLDSVVVSVDDNCISYIDSLNNQVLVELDKNDVKVICTLIELSPKQILLHDKSYSSLKRLILQLFDGRVKNCT